DLCPIQAPDPAFRSLPFSTTAIRGRIVNLGPSRGIRIGQRTIETVSRHLPNAVPSWNDSFSISCRNRQPPALMALARRQPTASNHVPGGEVSGGSCAQAADENGSG